MVKNRFSQFYKKTPNQSDFLNLHWRGEPKNGIGFQLQDFVFLYSKQVIGYLHFKVYIHNSSLKDNLFI